MDQKERANAVFEELLLITGQDSLVSETSVNIFEVLDSIHLYSQHYGYIVRSICSNIISLINLLRITRTLSVYDLIFVTKSALVKPSFRINKFLADNEIAIKSRIIL